MGSRRPLRIAFAVCLGAAGCSLWNRVDVCDHKVTEPVTLNHRVEGNQKTSTPGSMAALPGGNALVVFASEVGGLSADQAMELRSMRLDPGGARLPSCERNDQVDDVLIPVDLANPAQQYHESAFAAAPAGAGRAGLISYRAAEAGGPTELWGLFFQADGCPFLSGSPRRKPFVIASALAGEELVGNTVVAIDGKTEDDFLVMWVELSTADVISVKARVVRITPSGPLFMPTVLAPGGGVAVLPATPRLVYSLAPVLMGDGKLAVAVHYSTDFRDSNVMVWFLDDRLSSFAPTAQVSQGDVRGELLPGRTVTAAFDGRTLLVGWLQNDPAEHVSFYTRALDGRGRPLGDATQVGTTTDAVDGYPTAMAWPTHGFLATWRQQSGRADAPGSRIVGRRLDAGGNPAFTGLSCGDQPFVIAHQPESDRRMPTVTALRSDDVLAVWTDDDKRGSDASGSSVQGRVIAIDSLFVGDERPGRAPGRAPPDARVEVPADAAAGIDPDATPDAPLVCSPTPGQVLPGGPCLCREDCSGGGQCFTELPSGLPGGVCYKGCDKANPDSCGPNGRCEGAAPDPICLRACTVTADCGPFRVCEGGVCVAYCGSNADCRSGFCDPYRNLCTADGQPLSGAGLGKDCLRDDDCRSRMCSPNTKRCKSTCAPDRPFCPENSVCVPLPDGVVGVCLFACGLDGKCADPTLSCQTDPASGKQGCL